RADAAVGPPDHHGSRAPLAGWLPAPPGAARVLEVHRHRYRGPGAREEVTPGRCTRFPEMHNGLIRSGLSICLAAVGVSAEAAQPASRNRSEIPAQYRWDFAAIYPSWDAWEAGMKELEAKMDAFAALKGSLGKGPADLLQAYRALDEIGILQYRVFRYPQLQRDTDTRAQDVAGKFQRVSALFARFGTITAWFTPELLAIPQAQFGQW